MKKLIFIFIIFLFCAAFILRCTVNHRIKTKNIEYIALYTRCFWDHGTSSWTESKLEKDKNVVFSDTITSRIIIDSIMDDIDNLIIKDTLLGYSNRDIWSTYKIHNKRGDVEYISFTSRAEIKINNIIYYPDIRTLNRLKTFLPPHFIKCIPLYYYDYFKEG